MVLSFKEAGVEVLFYNLRKPVLRSLRATCGREQVTCCRSELEVYAHIETTYGVARSLPLNPSHRSRSYLFHSYAEC